MLTILLGTDWTANSDAVLKMISRDVAGEKGNRILIVPELISHDTERRLCEHSGDTASRFAEVLSFTRLARRVSESVRRGAQECLDNGGRVVAMASAARQMHGSLKAYASVETRPEFLTGLVDAVDEFKRCCISAEDLMHASKQTEGVLAQKLEELSLLLNAYDGLCSHGKRDPRDQMTWLLEQLEENEFAKSYVFYIDGFPDFTRQHFAIITHLIQYSPDVVISLNCDEPNSGAMAFEKAGKTAWELIRFAKDAGIPYQIRHVVPNATGLEPVRNKLFQGSIHDFTRLDDRLRVYRTETVYEECLAAAQQIRKYVESGARYRDISVVCSDMVTYRNTISMVFDRFSIPVYIAGTEDVLEKSVISTVLSAMDAALSGFEQREVFRYMKSMLSPLSMAQCDKLENYAILWNINGSRWLQEWTNHPVGLGENWTERTSAELSRLNQYRAILMDPLERLYNSFRDAVNLSQQVTALYQFLEDIKLARRLSDLAQEMDRAADNRSAQILNQLWDILMTAMEQLYDVLGETSWDMETFTRLFKLLLSQYDVGTIPPVLDAVTVGPVSAMRCQRSNHLIVLGVLEGMLPGYSGSAGVLTDQERTMLRDLGVPLTGGAMEGVQAEFSEIFGVFCGAKETLCVSCPSGQPSYLYRRLAEMAGGESCVDLSTGTAEAHQLDAAAYLMRLDEPQYAEALGISGQYASLQEKTKHQLGTITRHNIEKLYGDTLYLSASQVDKQADCRFGYFLRYGLRAKERKSVTVDPAEFGTYVHAVLEQTGRKVMELGGFRQVSLEQMLEIARGYSEGYITERFSQIDSERLHYLFLRNVQELEMVVQELWQELQESSFVPVEFEVPFGSECELGAIDVSGRLMRAQLRGFVDRVDAWKDLGRNYYRVVDYKTGKKDFDYCDVYNGLGLQMLLYLFALEDEGESLLGANPVPAGVQYFPARAPLVASDGKLSQEEAEAARQKIWKRRGLLLEDEDVLNAMEPGDKPRRLCCTRRKDGTLTGDLADREQLRMLKGYVFTLLGKMVDDIASGCVEPNPYTRGSSHNACAFCPYGAVCHQATVEGRRDYKSMTAQRFWEEVEKEMSNRG